jgi:phosphoglycolate phosphatase
MLLNERMLAHSQFEVVVLWDIDGTLIEHAPALEDRHALAASFVIGERVGKIDNGLGKTDRQILTEIMRMNGCDPTKTMITAAMAELDVITVEDLSKSPSEALDGVRDVLILLHGIGASQLLLTGNTPARAKVKVSSAGLADFFDFGHGFFGDEAGDRFELTTYAQSVLASNRQKVVIVGDTPMDIHAARHANMQVVAVATGLHSVSDLSAENPDLVLRNFVDSGKILKDFITELLCTDKS